MSKEKRFSDEFLNAFVDNQIAAEEKSQAFIEIGQDEALNRQVCELRKLHDLVQLAYREPPAPPVRTDAGSTSRHARLRFGVAASLLLMLGVLLGGLVHLPDTATLPKLATAPSVKTERITLATLHKHITSQKAASHTNVSVTAAIERATAAPVASLQSVSAVAVAATPTPVVAQNIADGPQTKVLIHLARDDVSQLGQALDDIEGLLNYYRDTRQNARVEVVVNGGGMELVRTDTSVFAERIQRLQREYSNLTFAACQNTIERLSREHGVVVRLLPGVIIIDSGMAEIMRRQNQGWAYVQV